MQESILDYISSSLLKATIKSYTPLSGGDISKVYLLEGTTQKYLLKTHKSTDAHKMLASEKDGLERISKTKSIKTPKVFFLEKFEDVSLVLMEYIETKNPNQKDYEKLGFQLAALHKNSTVHFGLEVDNFIGSLPQSNKKHKDWISFFIKERLQAQLDIAKSNSLLSLDEIPSFEKLQHTCTNLFPEIRPALLHGDLWGGNILISSDGTPYLIDPAVYYGHSEVDLAMSKLFGGFSAVFYKAYHCVIPELSGAKERNDLYQLYYLLVHLNLFGKGYYGSVKRILEYYF